MMPADSPRKSYMTKEQLEAYLADLRNNRPQRPSPNGARPLSVHGGPTRFSLLRTATATSSSSPIASDDAKFTAPRLTSTPPPGSEGRRRSNLLTRRGTHKRSSTATALPSFLSFSSTPESDSPEPKPWDGKDLQDGRMGDLPRRSSDGGVLAGNDVTGRRSSLSRRRQSVTNGFRDFSNSLVGAVGGHVRSQSVSSGSSSGSGSSDVKKRVAWNLPPEDSADPAPPSHPLNPTDNPETESELNDQFSSPTASTVPPVAPLRITKSASGRSTPVSSRNSSTEPKLPMVPERSATHPLADAPRKEYTPQYPRRRNYVDLEKNEPSQHNKVRYTTNNPAPLPSPPTTGSSDGDDREGWDEETEILKELGRRPLPRAGRSNSIDEPPVRKNNTKYGAQIKPPSPPTIAVVTAPSTMPSAPRSAAPKAASAPAVPTISLPDDPPTNRNVPSISLPDDPVIPSINLPSDNTPSSRPLPPPKSASTPTINAPEDSRRPLPRPRPRPNPSIYANHPTTNALRSRGPTATCNLCRTPIEGRIVSASSLRFHPECFRCDHCHTSLEHVGFYPEPADARRARLEANTVPDALADSSVRFYCHLDFHELFSPRCKSCKTPIESEVIVACGATWHQGHFFCAECGDPFTGSDRFVEKEGYAWCVSCYQKRYSGRCKKCRKPVLDTVVKALDGEWHEECFCCMECSATFDDGRFFVRKVDGRDVPVCVACEERRLKM